MNKVNPIREKILLLLLAGIALSFTYSPYRQRKIFKAVSRAWKKINERKLKQEIQNLRRSHLVSNKRNLDGSVTYVITEKGKLKALPYRLKEMRKQKNKWDGKYRVIMFDIPENFKKARDVFRRKLKEMGFYELQKSVFVFPFDCKKEIEFIIEFLHLENYVRYGVLKLDNDSYLRKIFKLT